MYIQNRRDSIKFNGCCPFQLLCSLITQSPTLQLLTVAINADKPNPN